MIENMTLGRGEIQQGEAMELFTSAPATLARDEEHSGSSKQLTVKIRNKTGDAEYVHSAKSKTTLHIGALQEAPQETRNQRVTYGDLVKKGTIMKRKLPQFMEERIEDTKVMLDHAQKSVIPQPKPTSVYFKNNKRVSIGTIRAGLGRSLPSRALLGISLI